MKAHEVMENLKHIVRYPHDADDAVEALFTEWMQQQAETERLQEMLINVVWQELTDGLRVDNQGESTYEEITEYLAGIGYLKKINSRIYEIANKKDSK